jgi:replication factor A2
MRNSPIRMPTSKSTATGSVRYVNDIATLTTCIADLLMQITFVGQIRNVSTQTTNITYKVDDGTGTVEVKQWIDSDTSNSDQGGMEDLNKSRLVENAYCRVWGRLKAFNNKRHVGAHVIRPITDYNEINYHLLEATAVHLFFTRGPPMSKDGQRTGGVTNGDGAGDERNGRAMPKMTPVARSLYDALKQTPQSNEGLHVQMLASQLQAGVNDVYKAAEELIGMGLIFTTVDDNTWAILEF